VYTNANPIDKRNYKASQVTPKGLSGSLEIQYFPSSQLRKLGDGQNLDTQNRTHFVIHFGLPSLLLSTHTHDIHFFFPEVKGTCAKCNFR